MNPNTEFNELSKVIAAFGTERDWDQYHTPKDVAISISLEAAELLEHFQWKSPQEIERYVVLHRDELADEAADVLNYLIIFANKTGIDLIEASQKKLAKNAAKYPVEKARGNQKKYTELADKQ